MFGHDLSGLEDDIKRLKDEAPAVLCAVDNLDQEIYNGINENRLHNGSHVNTRMLDALNANQRQRVLANFDRRFYEHEASKHQYKVVVDYIDSRIALFSEDVSGKDDYLHIHRPV